MVLDEMGTSKGFGFIRFGNETEQTTALSTMQGIAGLGSKPIKVKQGCIKIPRLGGLFKLSFRKLLNNLRKKDLKKGEGGIEWTTGGK